MAKVLSGKALARSKDLIVSGSHCNNSEYAIDLLSADKKRSERIIMSESEVKMIVKAWIKNKERK